MWREGEASGWAARDNRFWPSAKRFQAKWRPVRVKKTRQTKNFAVSILIETGF
jgi:hypothetical protein